MNEFITTNIVCPSNLCPEMPIGKSKRVVSSHITMFFLPNRSYNPWENRSDEWKDNWNTKTVLHENSDSNNLSVTLLVILPTLYN